MFFQKLFRMLYTYIHIVYSTTYIHTYVICVKFRVCVCIALFYMQLVEAVHNVKELVERQRRPPTPPEEEGITI